MSEQYNDVEWQDLPKECKTVSLLGNIDCDEIYMDLYGGTVSKNPFSDQVTKYCTLLKLK